MVDRLIGDEVIGLYLPGMADQIHARKAIQAAKRLLGKTGHGALDGPWIPVGIGVHTGLAFVGVVGGGEDGPNDFTALGDNVNITARLASQASPGEVLISDEAYTAAGIDFGDLERQQIELKEKRKVTDVRILRL